MQRDDATLLDIAKAARLASSFIAGMTKESFLDDIKTQSSVLYQLAVSVKRSNDSRKNFVRNILMYRGNSSRGCAITSFMATTWWIGMKSGRRRRKTRLICWRRLNRCCRRSQDDDNGQVRIERTITQASAKSDDVRCHPAISTPEGEHDETRPHACPRLSVHFGVVRCNPPCRPHTRAHRDAAARAKNGTRMNADWNSQSMDSASREQLLWYC